MSTTAPAYPARIEGRLDPGLSRWLWLVKWLLLIPHLVVLVFLWIGFAFTTVIAFFAILFTGRYPRALFDYGVGVLRWSWRVSFYAFDANGTDRYPPFALAATDYPATFEVEYPERLSRGLVLVKWWLLAIPHYLVLGFLLGGSWLAWDDRAVSPGGLIAMLVLIAVVALLFTGRYPRGIFDLVLGLNRWVLRVAAYSLLMTDRYPPFRLDLGPTDGPVVVPRRETSAETPGAKRGRSAAGGVLAIVGGGLVGLVGLGLLAGGVGLVAIDQTQRDSRGFLMTQAKTLTTPTYAITSRRIDSGIGGRDTILARKILGTVRVRVDSSRPVFLGIARSADVDRYLGGVRHEEMSAFGQLGRHATDYVLRPGRATPAPPATQSMWAARTQGAGEQTLTWKVRDGSWQVVMMNAAGAPRVTADVSAGARVPHLLTYGFGLLGGAVVLLAAGAGLVYLGTRGSSTVARRP
jgi:hypothetical protein